jgi:hypothetical protein
VKEHTTIAADLSKSVFRGCRLARAGPRLSTPAALAQTDDTVLHPAPAGHGAAGGLRLLAPLGPGRSRVWAIGFCCYRLITPATCVPC